MPVIPVLGKWRQEDLCEFMINICYIARPGLKNKTNKRKTPKHKMNKQSPPGLESGSAVQCLAACTRCWILEHHKTTRNNQATAKKPKQTSFSENVHGLRL